MAVTRTLESRLVIPTDSPVTRDSARAGYSVLWAGPGPTQYSRATSAGVTVTSLSSTASDSVVTA